jgi:hypothetical protein
MHNIEDLKQVNFPKFDQKESFLVVYESGKSVPFQVHRLFIIKTEEACNRGAHAHKACTQLFSVLQGSCTVTCDDGKNQKSFELDSASMGLWVPPTLWASQAYQPGTILMVLTDQPYDEEDYIRDYVKFLDFRKKT